MTRVGRRNEARVRSLIFNRQRVLFSVIPQHPACALDTVSGILTITTDFGLRDAYVPVMKASIMHIDPQIHIVDVTHE
ncbi:MAG: SAM-dependent chlorinase/fluorinase, partial [Rhodothermia bacterium]|nr:SAM-dependent chlorinase/fluorinase [Rhodothermia bacterium]